MLPKKNRLKEKNDFNAIYLKGKFFSLGELSIKFAKNKHLESRIGFAIGKKYSKLAIERNRAKRVLRSAMFALLDNIKPGFDIIIMMTKKQSATPLKKDVVLQHLQKILAKNNLLK